jgi:Tol biopolymer transport system component
MSTFVIQQTLLGFVRLLATAVAAGWIGSPMSWSPDGRWLSYTMAPDSASAPRRPGWLFDATSAAPETSNGRGHADGRADGPVNPPAGPGSYRIWASQRDGGTSVLIEESATPLTAPRWHPRARSLAFGRFVPDSVGPRGPSTHGRLDLVIRDGLDRGRTVPAVPECELDDQTRTQIPQVAPAWSPDGQFLAFPRPGHTPGTLIIRVESHRVVQTLDSALMPSWSPDGTKLAYIHQDDPTNYGLHVVERQGQSFTGPRAIVPIGNVVAPVGWGGDGRSILAVVERTRLRSSDLDLARIAPDSGESTRIFSIVPEIVRRAAKVRGVAIDFDRNEELCFFSASFEGRDTDVCWSIPRDQLPYKRFHPLDPSLPIVSLAIAPDGHAVAMRFGAAEGLSPPIVCELETEHAPPTERTTLIAPDDAAREAWRTLLVRTAQSLLAIVAPPIVVDGKPIGRPTVLPLPDEIPAAPPIRSRFVRLGRYGASLGATPRPPEAAAIRDDAGPESELDLEDRLFFDYLCGDYAAAVADLDPLEARLTTRERRLALLSLRAQILWAQGDTDRAREVANYLVEAVGGAVHRVEETPLGRSLAPAIDSGRAWARYLAARAAQPLPPTAVAAESNPNERDDPLLVNPFAPFGPPGLDLQRGPVPGDPLPFAPNILPGQREAFRARLLQLQQQLQLDAQRRLPQAPPLPRPIEGRPLR